MSRIVSTPGDIRVLRENVRRAAGRLLDDLSKLGGDPMEALYTLRFGDYGHHPIRDGRTNFSEQLNQSSNIMATLAAAETLLEWFPDCGGLHLNLGNERGRRIESVQENVVAAQAFAAVATASNDALRRSTENLENSLAANRYVFCYVPTLDPGRRSELDRVPGIQVWALCRSDIL